MDLLSDWFKELVILNKDDQKERIGMEPWLAVPTPVVEWIFLTCTYFDQPNEVRYLSVELFDRFIRLHFRDLLMKVWNEKGAEEKWKTVEAKLDNQTSLRMLSCIQIASKFILHNKILRPKEIQKYLKDEGKTFTLKMIMASEIRVWKTLNFWINVPTVLLNVEILLEQVKTSPLPSDVRERATLLTDMVYLHHQEIFCKLFYLTTGRWDVIPQEKQAFLHTECNILYRAAAVVALAVTFTSRNLEEGIFEEVARLTNLLPTDIRALANIINQIVMS